MTPQFSIYLDLLRFVAAAWVVVAHLQNWGLASWLPPLSGRDAVVLFFVLSGLVITHAASGRTFRQYAVARMGRIYSVALPVLLLAVAVDRVGIRYDPSIYPIYQYEKLWLYVPFHLAFLGDFWTISEQPFSVPVWWSLNYEVWYYILFAAVVYWRNWRRMVLVGVVLVAMGYKLWLLLPIWLAGSWLYGRIDRMNLSRRAARFLMVGTVVAYVILEILGVDQWLWHLADLVFGGSAEASPLGSARKFLADWLVGVLVLTHLVGWRYAGWEIAPGVASVIRWSAGFTFTLYLLHGVILHLALAMNIVDKDSPTHGMIILCFVFMVTIAVSLFTERLRSAWVQGFNRIWGIAGKAAWHFPRVAASLAPSR